MPIIELKLTGPASQKELMERDWQLVKQGVGDNLIFEGTEGLAQKIGKSLKEKKLHVVVSEQFSAGLLSWTLNSAGIVMSSSQILSLDAGQTLETLVQRAQKIAANHPLSIALVVGEYHEQYLNVVLSTPDKCYAQRIHYLPNNHSQKEKQEVSVMLILDMLSRWLNGREVIGYYEWLVQTETLILES